MMMNNRSFNKVDNPFELGTNEKALPTNPLISQAQTPPPPQGGILSSTSDNFLEANPYINNILPSDIVITNNQAELTPALNPLAFADEGKAYITFDHPPAWFVKQQSLKIIEQATNGNDPHQESLNNHAKEITEFKQTIENVEGLAKKDSEKDPGTLKKTAQALPKIASPFKKPAMLSLKGGAFILSSWGELFISALGFGPENKKPQTKDEQDKKQKEAKKNENKQKYWGKLAELSRPPQITGIVKDEMIATNKTIGFYEKYKGVIDAEANITQYHKSLRSKKEIENKAAQIKAERDAKMAKTGGKKKIGPNFGQREGELLMGAENPSHFTKALG